MPTLTLWTPLVTTRGDIRKYAVYGEARKLRAMTAMNGWADGGNDEGGDYFLCDAADMEALVAWGMIIGPQLTNGPSWVGHGIDVAKLSWALDVLISDLGAGAGPLQLDPEHRAAFVRGEIEREFEKRRDLIMAGSGPGMADKRAAITIENPDVLTATEDTMEGLPPFLQGVTWSRGSLGETHGGHLSAYAYLVDLCPARRTYGGFRRRQVARPATEEEPAVEAAPPCSSMRAIDRLGRFISDELEKGLGAEVIDAMTDGELGIRLTNLARQLVGPPELRAWTPPGELRLSALTRALERYNWIKDGRNGYLTQEVELLPRALQSPAFFPTLHVLFSASSSPAIIADMLLVIAATAKIAGLPGAGLHMAMRTEAWLCSTNNNFQSLINSMKGKPPRTIVDAIVAAHEDRETRRLSARSGAVLGQTAVQTRDARAGDAGDPSWRAPASFSVAELHTVDSLLANADFMARVASAVRTFEDPETPDYMALRMLSGGRTKSHPLARPFALLLQMVHGYTSFTALAITTPLEALGGQWPALLGAIAVSVVAPDNSDVVLSLDILAKQTAAADWGKQSKIKGKASMLNLMAALNVAKRLLLGKPDFYQDVHEDIVYSDPEHLSYIKEFGSEFFDALGWPKSAPRSFSATIDELLGDVATVYPPPHVHTKAAEDRRKTVGDALRLCFLLLLHEAVTRLNRVRFSSNAAATLDPNFRQAESHGCAMSRWKAYVAQLRRAAEKLRIENAERSIAIGSDEPVFGGAKSAHTDSGTRRHQQTPNGASRLARGRQPTPK